MNISNEQLKFEIKKNGLTQWQLADLMGISESTLIRKLRHPLSEDEEKKILDLIHEHGGGQK